jgi:hypothetical protein
MLPVGKWIAFMLTELRNQIADDQAALMERVHETAKAI